MVEIAKTCAGIVLGCFGSAMVPLFDMPFDGCTSQRWFELYPACGHWPEVLRGVLFVLPIALFAPVRWMAPVFANIVLLEFAFVGGVGGFSSGLHFLPVTTRIELFKEGYPLVIGGLVAMLPWVYRRLRATRND